MLNHSHPFHRNCIETHLASSAECPVCKHACELNELRNLIIVPKAPPIEKVNARDKGRGAMVRQYNTRSVSRNLFQDSQSASLNATAVAQTDNLQTPIRNISALNNTNPGISPFQNNPNQPAAHTAIVDYNEINRMIECSVTRILQNLHFSQTSPVNTYQNIDLNPQSMKIPSQNDVRNNRDNNFTVNQTNLMNNPTINPINGPNNDFNMNPNTNPSFNTHNVCGIPQLGQIPLNSQGSNLTANTFNFNSSNMNADKITSIIHNWNLKFDGSANGLNIDEFLYRVKTLTRETFNDDFSVICKNLNTLLTGKAREWYWWYHKLVPVIVWEDFCKAIRAQYKDMKSSFDLREEIRNRKQKPGESYDNFFDALSIIADRLPRPMVEEEFIEIIARNLRPEIRQDLLYVPIRSLSHLRKLVQMRENFLSDEYVRKSIVQRSPNSTFLPRRQVAEIDNSESLLAPDREFSVEALQKSDPNFNCWNCEKPGHHWQDCLEDRTIFCYGCGTRNVYKAQCVKCASRTLSNSKNLRQMGPQKDQI